MRIALSVILCLVFSFSLEAKPKKKNTPSKANPIAKKLFETNCLACHDPLKTIVGPTLYEINKLYEKNTAGIVSWAKKPGRKRTNGIAMPAMAHIPEKDLELIAEYMLFAGSRVNRKNLRAQNIFKEKLGKIQRTFMPNSSVVSFAINFNDHLSLCWDADKGMTRYIWQGKIDPQTHFTGNGKVIPSIDGDVIYNASEPVLQNLPEHINFLGYKVNDQGLPSFLYTRGDYSFQESLNYNEGNIYWNYKISGLDKLAVKLPQINGYKTTISHGKADANHVTLNTNELSDFTITLSKEK
jgi:mono/diheme cytochrome c family protein